MSVDGKENIQRLWWNVYEDAQIEMGATRDPERAERLAKQIMDLAELMIRQTLSRTAILAIRKKVECVITGESD
jgi:hypothetical protein